MPTETENSQVLTMTEQQLVMEEVKKIAPAIVAAEAEQVVPKKVEDAAVEKVGEVVEVIVPAVVTEKAEEIVPQKVAAEVADIVQPVVQKVAEETLQGPKLMMDAGMERPPSLPPGSVAIPLSPPGADKPGIQAFGEAEPAGRAPD